MVLVVGLIVSNTVGTPVFARPAIRTEFYIKTGLVLLGAEVLFNRLLVLGIPGVLTSWLVTPVVLIGTYAFGQRVLKMESRSLNMVICADMSVCGVSAAIATAAACRAKKEELSLAIGLSLAFTVAMMVAMPPVIQWLDLGPVVGGAWIGGTIDSTGAVAAAGGMLGETALAVAATVKMIQNILIGFVAFGVAVYWVTMVERSAGGRRPSWREIGRRFPKFVLGFLAASLAFSAVSTGGLEKQAVTGAVIGDTSEPLRSWLFCLAFVSIGLETNFRELSQYFASGKPLVLYVCGQAFNLALSLLMCWLIFDKAFPDVARAYPLTFRAIARLADVALTIVVAVAMIVWLRTLPLIGQHPVVSDHIRRNEQQGIDPAAKFYTELPVCPPPTTASNARCTAARSQPGRQRGLRRGWPAHGLCLARQHLLLASSAIGTRIWLLGQRSIGSRRRVHMQESKDLECVVES